jgi:DNA-binding NarL/FixJ family response regulator
MNTPEPIDVVVIEDDPLYRESLVTLLTHTPAFRFTGAWDSAVTALESLEAATSPPRLVLMDMDLPGMRGSEATRRLKLRWPEILVIVLTVFEEPAPILEAICAGADGYLLKRSTPAELLEQFRIVVEGGSPLTPEVARTVMKLLRQQDDPSAAPRGEVASQLTGRERDVLRGLVDGLAYKQVAERLGISIDTVRTHVRGLYRKLQVHSVAEAVTRALRERLI